MDLQTLLSTIISLLIGAVLTYTLTALTTRAANKREDERERRHDAKRRASDGREHAKAALKVIRRAQQESLTRTVDEGSYDIDLRDLGMEIAEAEIDLIPDELLRQRLSGVLDVVRYPWTLASSSYSEGAPFAAQRRALWLLRQALAAYVREEPTPVKTDALARLARANEDAHAEHAELEAQHAPE